MSSVFFCNSYCHDIIPKLYSRMLCAPFEKRPVVYTLHIRRNAVTERRVRYRGHLLLLLWFDRFSCFAIYLNFGVQFGLQLMYELCVDPITCGPVVELLRGEKYEFFSKVCLPFPWLD